MLDFLHFMPRKSGGTGLIGLIAERKTEEHRLGAVFGLVLQRLIYVNTAVPDSHTRAQDMKFTHQRVIGKLFSHKREQFFHLFRRNLDLTSNRFVVEVFHGKPPLNFGWRYDLNSRQSQ